MNFTEIPSEIAEKLRLSEDKKTARPKDMTDAEILYIKYYLKDLPELQMLDLRDCVRMTDAGVRQLKEALPKCNVICSDSGMNPWMYFLRDAGMLLVGFTLAIIILNVISGRMNVGGAGAVSVVFGIAIGGRYRHYFGRNMFG